MKASFLEVRDLTVTFSRWGQTVAALNSVNLRVPRGQWLILVGPNGSGKSTLLKSISGRTRPSSGEILVEGRSLNSMSTAEAASKVFHVHQDPLLGTAPILTVFENLAVADREAQLNRESRRLLTKKYDELLKPLGLAERLRQPALTLSGGERQLLALLIARLRPSSLVLLDEPLAALDPVKVEMCLKEIDELHRQGRTIIQVTHDQESAVSLGDRTVALQGGRIFYDEMSFSRSRSALDSYWSVSIAGD